MPKKRRKLIKILRRKYIRQKNVELVLAKIYDIDDEDIQKEYMSAFNAVVYTFDKLKNDYELVGFNDNSENLIADYNNAFSFLNQSLKSEIYFFLKGMTGISIRFPFIKLDFLILKFFMQVNLFRFF